MARREITIAQEALIEAPIERVWELIDDPALMGEWFAFAESMELVEGTGAGRLQRLHSRWGQRRSEIDQLVTAYDPPFALAWRHTDERVDGQPASRYSEETTFAVTLQREGEGTRVRMVPGLRPAGPVKGLLMRLLATTQTAGRLDASLSALAERAQGPPAAPDAFR
jgi:uncharacterized protein YndB with AHSA1/START domain